eukprot:TRINITY_DN11292_c0_g1_i1.p1 TRINITY_DN11292_c0_g1~~TRINITY_DN11292_c0_g1_i1.p1  ORF type:complete len:798 (+),score=210.56 TRINITY_DN11292_c0_g1_i1:139-2394(+)
MAVPSPKEVAAPVASDPRADLVKSVFSALDLDGDGCLNASEMRPFADHTGFDGSAEDWAAEFETICSEAGSSRGVPLAHFIKLVNDESDDGAYCTDDELHDLSSKLSQAQAPFDSANTVETPPWLEPPAMPPPPPPPGLDSPMGAAANGFGFGSAGSSDRVELLRTAFSLLDKDGNGRLSCTEMYVFAMYTGFEGTVDAWSEEYQLLCRDKDIDSRLGVDFLSFCRMADDEVDYIQDGELTSMVSQIQPQDVETSMTAGGSSSSSDPTAEKKKKQGSPRANLIKGVFQALDADGDGYLSEKEMKAFATRIGFDGGDADWSSEFSTLCAEVGTSVIPGLELSLFAKLVDDPSDKGCMASDAELRKILRDFLPAVQARQAQLQTAAAVSRPRTELVKAVFDALDRRKVGRLSSGGMRIFADLCGFSGSNEDWAAEYSALFSAGIGEFVSENEGISLAHFANLVDDESENGSYCTDAELGLILDRLQPAARGPLVNAIFLVLDRDGDGLLGPHDLRALKGSEFSTAVKQLVAALQKIATREAPMGSDILSQLVDGTRDRGVPKFSNESLRVALKEFQQNCAGKDEECADNQDDLARPEIEPDWVDVGRGDMTWPQEAQAEDEPWEDDEAAWSTWHQDQQQLQQSSSSSGRVWRPQGEAATGGKNSRNRGSGGKGKGKAREDENNWWESSNWGADDWTERSGWAEDSSWSNKQWSSSAWSEWQSGDWDSQSGRNWGRQSSGSGKNKGGKGHGKGK